MSFIYMSQQTTTLFIQAMVNNAIYKHANNQSKYSLNQILSAGFLFSIISAILIIVIFWNSKGYIFNKLKISIEAKEYAREYLFYMIPFLILYNILQYFVYVFYALNLPVRNIVIFAMIIILNIIFNYIGVQILNLGIISVTLASGLSIACLLPFIYIRARKSNIFLNFTHDNKNV